jgi:hypothetical protein
MYSDPSVFFISSHPRVDGLRSAHAGLLKVAKAYETEGYDYPVSTSAADEDGRMDGRWQEIDISLRSSKKLKLTIESSSRTLSSQTQIQESVNLLSTQVSHSVTSWAASAAKGTNLPPIQATSAPENVHRTLAHALSRSAASGAIQLGASPTNIAGLSTTPGSAAVTENAQPTRLGEALQKFALAQDRLGNARLAQDEEIREGFLKPWQSFGSQVNVAMK